MTSNFIRLMFAGALSLAFLIASILMKHFNVIFWNQYRVEVNSLAALGALLIYQPHFIAVYQLNYTKGSVYLKKHSFIFVWAPIFFVIFLALSLQFQNIFLYKFILFLTILFGLSHFSAQAAATTFSLAGCSLNFKFKSLLKSLFLITSLYGLCSFIAFHHGKYLFYVGLNIDFSGFLFSSQQLNIGFYSLIMGHFGMMNYAYKQGVKKEALIPWLAFLCWYTSDLMLQHFYYIIPIFHALQFIPFYFNSELRPGWRSVIFLVIISLFVIFALPNIISLSTTTLFFAAFLLVINLHHFMMERITWIK